MMNENFIIPLNGLASGENLFSWYADKAFFDKFENKEILEAGLDVSVRVEKSGRYVGVDCSVDGKLTVECDRCLESLDMPIEVDIYLSVKYGDEESSEEHQEGEREVIFVSQTDAEFDLSQIIYDYVCLSLPMQRVHEDGRCNPETLKYYGVQTETHQEEEVNPFAALKDMFK